MPVRIVSRNPHTTIATLSPLSHLSNLTGNPTQTWSTRVSERYHVPLTADLVHWFDNGIWEFSGTGEYRDPVSPEMLLEPSPEVIWPGLMPPDFLPLVGNCAGDWLCMRLGPGSQVAEIVQWYHGGGDWLPWGKTLAEAIVFDAVSEALPGLHRGHAVPAEPVRLESANASDPLFAWAIDQMPSTVAEQLKRLSLTQPSSDVEDESIEECLSGSLAMDLLRAGVAEVPIRCELVQRLLGDRRVASIDRVADATSRLGITQGKLNEWLFDLDRIPATSQGAVLEWLAESGSNRRPVQRWDLAAEHCRHVIAQAPHLAWPWDLLGYILARTGETDDAVRCFREGVRRSVFTDQSVKLRTHWAAEKAAKFSAAMLGEMADRGIVAASPSESRQSPGGLNQDTAKEEREYLAALCEAGDQRLDRVTEYWMRRAGESLAAGQYDMAYDQTYLAGWDLGASSLETYGAILDQLIQISELNRDAARAELARTHRRCLLERTGV